MKTVGELLKNARIKKGLSLTKVSEKTKIQVKFIAALENNDFSKLPESAFVKGFIRNYAQALGKDPKTLLAILRRDFAEDAKGKVIPRGLARPLNQPRIRWTPQATMVAFASLIITVFSTYLILQFRLLSGVPKLSVSNPQENQTVSTLVTVEGTTDPQATVNINSKSVQVGESGEFSDTIGLTQGKHTITVQAKSRTGKTKTLQRTVIVDFSH